MDEAIAQAEDAYQRAMFGGDSSGLDDAVAAVEHAAAQLDRADAGLTLAHGKLLHARYLSDRSAPTEGEPSELELFERAAQLYRDLHDQRGEGAATFWIGCCYQVILHDDAAAEVALRRAGEFARASQDPLTLSYVLRHQGIAEHGAGRLESARDLLEQSTALRRELGFAAGAAANLVGLGYLAAALGNPRDAIALLDEAETLAATTGAQAIVGQVEQARQHLSA